MQVVAAQQAPTKLPAIEVLALGVLYFSANRDESDLWTRYLDTVPMSYHSLISWPSSALKLLGCPRFEKIIAARKFKISTLYAHLRDLLQQHLDLKCESERNLWEYLTLETFSWAYATIMSRSVFVKNAALWNSTIVLQKDTAALPPLLDYFNHSNETECTAGYNHRLKRYELRTNQSWRAGDQVFIKYGAHSNETLLKHYGFAIERNLYDSISYSDPMARLLMVDIVDELSDQKFAKLRQNCLISQATQKVKHELSRDGLGWNTMVAIKTMLMTQEEMLNWDKLLNDEKVSDANEAAYYKTLLDWYQRDLIHLEAAEDEDKKLSEEADKSGALALLRHLARVFRAGRRELLQEAIKNIPESE